MAEKLFLLTISIWVVTMLIVWFSCNGLKAKFGGHIFARARIATNLIPLAEPCISEDTTIRITGQDGVNFAKSYRRWGEALERWAEKSRAIEYLLIDPSEDAIVAIKALKTKYPEKISFYKIDLERIVSEPEKAMIERVKTFHFVIFENPRQLWLELNHKKGELFATNCEYVPPEIANGDSRYMAVKDLYSKLIRAAELVA